MATKLKIEKKGNQILIVHCCHFQIISLHKLVSDLHPIDILTGKIEIEVTGVVGVSPALWYFRYIASMVIPTSNQDGHQAKNRKKGESNFNCPLLPFSNWPPTKLAKFQCSLISKCEMLTDEK
jgi:hypothetical protein